MSKVIDKKYIQYNTLTSTQSMVIFEKKNDSLYTSPSGMSLNLFTGSIGHLKLNRSWVLFNKEGLYLDHDEDIQLLAKRNKLDITPSSFSLK